MAATQKQRLIGRCFARNKLLISASLYHQPSSLRRLAELLLEITHIRLLANCATPSRRRRASDLAKHRFARFSPSVLNEENPPRADFLLLSDTGNSRSPTPLPQLEEKLLQRNFSSSCFYLLFPFIRRFFLHSLFQHCRGAFHEVLRFL